jgi:hypothetical protein
VFCLVRKTMTSAVSEVCWEEMQIKMGLLRGAQKLTESS